MIVEILLGLKLLTPILRLRNNVWALSTRKLTLQLVQYPREHRITGVGSVLHVPGDDIAYGIYRTFRYYTCLGSLLCSCDHCQLSVSNISRLVSCLHFGLKQRCCCSFGLRTSDTVARLRFRADLKSRNRDSTHACSHSPSAPESSGQRLRKSSLNMGI